MILSNIFSKVIFATFIPCILLSYLVMNLPDYPLNTMESRDKFFELSRIIINILLAPIAYSIFYFFLDLSLKIATILDKHVLSKIYFYIYNRSFYFYTWPLTFTFLCFVISLCEAFIFRINSLKEEQVEI